MDKLLFLKQLRLKNYCTYKDVTLNFCKEDGTPYKFVSFFGPNGIGKSNLLSAIGMLSMMNTTGRSDDRVRNSLVQFIRNQDYNPMYERLLSKEKSNKSDMLIEGVYEYNGNEYMVQLTENGYVRNDFAPIPGQDDDLEEAMKKLQSGPWGNQHLQYRQRIAHFVSADNDLSLNKFQLHRSQMKSFELIMSEITRFPVECMEPAGMTPQEQEFCTDFTLHKKDHKVHFKRMSAGEKKICKSFSILLNMMHALAHPSGCETPMEGWPRILLIDNVEMHVYYDRHITLINSLKRIFEKQQIFATTHSGTLITRFLRDENDKESELWIDLERFNG